MLFRIARLAALLLITAVVVWALVLGWWQSTDHTPTTSESLLYLLALPLALFGGFVLLSGFINGLRNPPAPKPNDLPATASTANDNVDAAERTGQLSILASSLITAVGDDAASVVAAAREGKVPGLDDELKDDDGFPVFTARVKRVDPQAFAEAIAPFGNVSTWPTRLLRGLALADQVLAELLPSVRETLEAANMPSLDLRLDWISDLMPDDATRDILLRWLHETHLAALEPRTCHVQFHTATGDADALQLIDSLALGLNRDPTPTIAIVVASTSHLDDAQIARWAADDRLFTAQRQSGQIPGEAAAGLAVATPELARQLTSEPLPRSSRINLHRRDKPADAGGRISAALCSQLCVDLLQLFDIEPATVSALTSDCDHRATRQAEALGVIDDSFEALEPSQDYLPLGTVCGSAPPASALVTLLCAAETAREKLAPVLALSVQHPTLRAVALLQPPSESTP